MLSSKSIGSGGGAASYYEGLAREDYYTEGGEPPGKWTGEYARELGLTGEVQKGELEAGFAGFHPRTGEQIANNAGTDHKAGYDLTFSAPKSVSAVWATADRETQLAISAAQQRAVEKALDYASNNAFHQRQGHAGCIKVEHTSGIAVATFEHGTSREGDPQLHTHALVLNVAENGKTIDFDTRWKHAAGAAYRAELASEMQKLGYTVSRDGTSFKVEGVPPGLEKEFSTRREQIEAAMREHGTSGGKAAQAAALATRQDKGEVNRAELFERAREVAKEHGFNPEDARSREFISGDSRAVEPEQFDSASFLAGATAQASTLTRPQLEKELLQAAQGSLTIDQALAKLEDLKQRGELVELRDSRGGENRWTTRDMHAIEQRIADTAGRMALEKSHPVSSASLDSAIAKKSLSDDQKQALRHITSPERIAVVMGVAGAGKSWMLDAAREAWQRDGYTVLGAALAGKAAEGLQESSGIESGTIHSLVGRLDLEQVKLDSRTVLVVDEAGMVGSRLFDRLQQYVDAAGAKLVLVGDTQQLQPIDAGGAMRAVQERAGAVSMDEIRRQTDPEQRQIVRDFKDGKAGEAIDRLEKLGQVKTYEAAADARSGMASAIVRDMQEGKTSIGLAGTRAEVHQINQQARSEAQQAGLVAREDHKFEAERGTRQFADGDRVIFLKNDRELGVKNGTTGTVERAAEGNLSVKLDNGKTVELGDMKYRDIDHGYAMTVHKSQGVTVDRAHLMPGKMTDQHAAYVGASRHRETVQIHGTAGQINEMRQTASKSHEKDTSAEARYTPIEREPVKPMDREPQPVAQQIEKLEQTREAFGERAAELRQAADQAKEAQPTPQPDQARPDQKPVEQAKDSAQAEQQPDQKPVEAMKGEPAKDAQPTPQPDQKPDQQPDQKPVEQAKDAQPEQKPEPKPELTTDAQPQPDQAQADQVKPELTPDQPQVEATKDAQPESRPELAKDSAQAEQPGAAPARDGELVREDDRQAKDAQPQPDQAQPEQRQAEPAKDEPVKDAQPQPQAEQQPDQKPIEQAKDSAQAEQQPDQKPVEAMKAVEAMKGEPAKDAQPTPQPDQKPDQKPVEQAKDAQPEQKPERERQLKEESTRQQERKPERQAERQRDLKTEAGRQQQRQPEKQRTEPERQLERERER